MYSTIRVSKNNEFKIKFKFYFLIITNLSNSFVVVVNNKRIISEIVFVFCSISNPGFVFVQNSKFMMILNLHYLEGLVD